MRVRALSEASHSRRNPFLLALPAALTGVPVWLHGVGPPLAIAAATVAYALAAGVLSFWARRSIARQTRNEIDLAAAFDRVVAGADDLPPTSTAALDAIRNTLASLLPRLPAARAAGGIGDDDLYFVRATIQRYLPDAVATWRQLPADRPPEADGSLRQQLTDIAERLAAIEMRLNAHLTQRLERNRKLIASR
ncbi:MAG TPA: hypothetical protein VFR86_03030 [Burkholderiaceae bacterium]|nr:hypothetical protein [Burkholderiaceae bacterium]